MIDQFTRTLILDDDPDWGALLAEILQDQGLAVDQTGNLDDAVEAMRNVSYRLAVVDLSLDGRDHRNRDGIKVLAALQEYQPGCTTILLTGYATVEIALSAVIEFGALTCLRKETFTRSAFREVVNQALAYRPPRMGTSPHSEPASSPRLSEGQGDIFPVSGLALVVEDDAGWRDILAELIAEAGYQAVTCRGFAEALGHLGRDKFALALVDLSLRHAGVMSGEGELSGQHLLSTAQAMGIPTIVVSGVSSPTLIEATFRRYGVFAWLEKQSFERRAFLDIVRSLQEDGQPARELADLTEREYQVLKLLVEGHSNQEIADILIVSINTVKQHLKAIYKKLDVSTRSAAVSKALVEGLQQSGNNK